MPLLDDFVGGGEMGERMRSQDWSGTPLGPIPTWPQSLKTLAMTMLHSRYPMFLAWGPQRSFLYNDAYSPILGKRHPYALGQPAAHIWSDIWDVIGPQMDLVLEEGRATWNEDCLLMMERNGYLEETYFTFSYSPAFDDAKRVSGVFCSCNETTGRVLAERRMRILRDLGTQAAQAKTVDEACHTALATLSLYQTDVPFALLFLLSGDGATLTPAGCAPHAAELPGANRTYDVVADAEDPWHLGEAVGTGRPVILTDLRLRLGTLPKARWPISPDQAVVLPLAAAGQGRPAGVLAVGLNPCRMLDDEYESFLHLLGGHIATAISNARAYQEERARAEALAELDRAKTAFFSNVSHEFRTPLTLMLGPVEELLAAGDAGLSPAANARLEIVHRNGLRLLRLVNSLLDFSRIEAGRVQACYEATDLSALTTDLASCFRSATQRAGLQLTVDCPALTEPVYVDRDLWEKIVFNLLSNAFKFTFAGEISVLLRERERAAELIVRDTGVGIPREAMPRLFERFYRVHNMPSRTYEGTGIGLALVQELVALHGGTVTAHSEIGAGSTFIVSIPFGRAHLPADQIASGPGRPSTAIGAGPFVEEALRWLPGEEHLPPLTSSERSSGALHDGPAQMEETAGRPSIVLADDNADMRQYVARLLAPRYRVEAVADGEAALAAVRARRPDLVLSDVMMPRMDGLGLLRALRDDPETRTIPVILLSARAGEESRVEGMERGADDYLIKPFSARELLARVAAHLQLARLRRKAQERVERWNVELEQAVNVKTAELRASHERLRGLATELNLAEQRERKRLAGELHDHLQQMLVLAKIKLAQGKRLAFPLPGCVNALTQADEVLSEALGYTRTLVAELSPPVLRDHGLAAGLQWLADYMAKHDVTVTVTVPEHRSLALPDDQAVLLFQSVRELLINSWKHAGTGRAAVVLEQRGAELEIRVSDQGVGFDPSVIETLAGRDMKDATFKYGLFSIRERMQALGGSFQIQSGRGLGTVATLRLPLLHPSGSPLNRTELT
jgi:signal transduction histidine kinase